MMSAYDDMAPPAPRSGEIARSLVEPAVVGPDGVNRAHVIDLLRQSRVRWLKNTEVCDILLNYRQYEFELSTTAPITPPAGTLYLFDRKTVRFFRKDGHDWQKKKDGKTVRETHEKLKVGNVELLNCYYAHAARDDRFQRRCYWLLNSDEGVVLVHYLHVTQKAAMQDFGQTSGGGSGSGSPRVPVPLGPPGAGGVHRVRSGGDVSSLGAPGAYHHQQVGQQGHGYAPQGFAPHGGFGAHAPYHSPSHLSPSHAFAGVGSAGVSHANVAAAAAHQYQRDDPWFTGALESGDDGGGYDAQGDADLDFFLRDASMDIGDASDAPAESSDGFGYAILRDFVHQEALAGGGAESAPFKHPSLGSLGSLGQAERRNSETLSVGGGDSQLGVAVAAAAGVGGDGASSAPKQEPPCDGGDHATGASMGPAAAAAAAAGPDVGTSFPASDADAVKRAPSRGASSNAGLALVNGASNANGGGRSTPPPAPGLRSDTRVVPGSFEDGVRTMQELESRVAELQQSLTRVANVTAEEARGQLSRLERDMSALESGHRAMASRGHRRRESVDRRGASSSRPMRWDARSDDDDGGGADEEDDDGEDDDDDEGDAGDDGDGTISSLAKAAAATRRPGAPGGASARDRARGGYAPKPLPSGSEIDLTDREDAAGGDGPRSPSPAAAAAQLRAAAATAHARASRGHHRAPPVIPANLSGAQILWEIVDFSPEWDGESGGAKVLVSGAPRPGWPEGMYLCCVFGNVEVPAEQISPGTLRCRAPPHAPGRVPFYISCLGSGKRPVSDIRTFEYREAGASNARDRRAAEVRLATGVTERDFQLRLVHLLIGADRSSVKSEGRGGGGSGGGSGASPGGGGSGSGSGGNDAGDARWPSTSGDEPASAPSGDFGGGGGGSAAAVSSGRALPARAAPPPGASFVKKTVAQLGLPGDPVSSPEKLSDEDVARVFRAALDARLRHAISAEAKSLRARAGVSGGLGAEPSALLTQQKIPAPGFVNPARSAYQRVDAGGVGIIHCVAALGMNWAIPALCKSGCDVNQPDRRRRTALHWAAAKGHEDTVATLLASGANIRATARWGAGGYTAADLAAALGHGGIAAYISETSLAASLSNISLYGGPQGAARRFGDRQGALTARRPSGPSDDALAAGAGSGLGADRSGRVEALGASRPPPAPTPSGLALAGVSSPMVADVDTPAEVRGGAGARGGRFARARGGAVPPMRSLLLATETEVTATDFDSRTDITDLETDVGESGAPGGARGGDEERRERTAAGMIQLAFRKHASRRRKLRRRVGGGAPGSAAAGAGLGSVEELAEPNPLEKKEKAAAAGGDSEDDEDEDEDVKRNVKKVVKKAEKAAMKITSSIRSLKTSKTAGADDARAAGKRGRGGNELAALGSSAPSEARDEAALVGDVSLSPSDSEATADVERRISELRARAGALLQDRERGASGSVYRRRVPAGDIMRLVKVNGLAGSRDRIDELRSTREGDTTFGRDALLGSPRSSPSRESRRKTKDSEVGAGSDASVRSAVSADDDDEEEEDAKVAVERIQAIIRSRRAREQYLRLRSVTMSLQERIAARARGEVPMGEDGDGEDIEVDDDDDDDEGEEE